MIFEKDQIKQKRNRKVSVCINVINEADLGQNIQEWTK